MFQTNLSEKNLGKKVKIIALTLHQETHTTSCGVNRVSSLAKWLLIIKLNAPKIHNLQDLKYDLCIPTFLHLFAL